MFLPLVIEKGIFELLKDHEAFISFQETYSRVPNFTYDVCFNNWPLSADKYSTDDFKQWYTYAESTLGDSTVLYDFWCSRHQDKVSAFIEQFICIFNQLAERNAVDTIPVSADNGIGENATVSEA